MRLSVVCEGQTSSQCPVTSDIPRDTVLVPLLFLLYMSDVPNNVQSSVKLFTVDALLCSIVASNADFDLLQSGLHICKLESRQYYGQVEFDPSKCKIVTISHKKNPPQRIIFSVVKSWNRLVVPIPWGYHQYQARVVSPCFNYSSKSKQIIGYNTTQPFELPQECERNSIYILGMAKTRICKCGLGTVFKERYYQYTGKSSMQCSTVLLSEL